MVVTNVIRMLDAKKIAYQAFELPVEKIGARQTADLLGMPEGQVFKTIVAVRPLPGSKPVLAMIPANTTLDLKALADYLKEKKIRVPTLREAEQLTGLQAGGISPLALINRGFQSVLDVSAERYDQIHISGGQRGLNIRLGVKDLIRLTNARVAEISQPDENAEDDE